MHESRSQKRESAGDTHWVLLLHKLYEKSGRISQGERRSSEKREMMLEHRRTQYLRRGGCEGIQFKEAEEMKEDEQESRDSVTETGEKVPQREASMKSEGHREIQ